MHLFDSKIAKVPIRKGDTPSRTHPHSDVSMSTICCSREVGGRGKGILSPPCLWYLVQPILNYHTSMHHFYSKIAKNPTRKGDTPSRTHSHSDISISIRVPCEQQLNMGQSILRDRRIPLRPSLCAPHPSRTHPH